MNSKGFEIEIIESRKFALRNSFRNAEAWLQLTSSQGEPDNTNKRNEEAISFSSKVVEVLKSKAKEHNKEHLKKVNLDQLKKIFRKGSSAYTVSHELGVSRTAWCLARVNTFLRMMSGQPVKSSYLKIGKNIIKASEIDISDNWEPNNEDISQSERDITDFNLDYDFEDENDLYLETQEEAQFLKYI